MKKITKFIAIVFTSLTLTSCATVFHGNVTESQKRKPVQGEEKRKLKAGAFIFDILLFPPSLIVDFVTGAIYKPKG